MSEESIRVVNIERTSARRYAARNARGGVIQIGGEGDSFTPVELFLAAIGSCTAFDVDLITSRRADPSVFQVRVTGDKIRDEAGPTECRTSRWASPLPFPRARPATRHARC